MIFLPFVLHYSCFFAFRDVLSFIFALRVTRPHESCEKQNCLFIALPLTVRVRRDKIASASDFRSGAEMHRCRWNQRCAGQVPRGRNGFPGTRGKVSCAERQGEPSPLCLGAGRTGMQLSSDGGTVRRSAGSGTGKDDVPFLRPWNTAGRRLG